MFRRGSFSGGIHPAESKGWTAKKPVQKLPVPPQVVIPIQQHIGAPAKPIVEKGATVRVGDLICEAGGFVSVPAHASISGTVSAIEERPHPSGLPVLSVVIDSDGADTWCSDLRFKDDYLSMDRSNMLKCVQAAGIVGMGGAAFPTHVKLSPPGDKPVDTIILNGAECEPYLTADHRLMVERPREIVLGLQIIAKILHAKYAAIGIENNKPDAVETLRKTISELGLPYKVIALRVKYPQGAEKQLINAMTGREVPSGGLPMDVGCVVQNVGTAVAVYEAIAYDRPLVERIVTVTGNGVKEPKNVLARIGSPYAYILEQCGGLTDDVGKIVMGGPMMGLAQSSLDIPVIKGTSGLLVLRKKESSRQEECVCISCGNCVTACPMKLIPKMVVALVKNGRLAGAEAYHMMDCIECGSCSFVCPAHINLLHYIRYGKSEVLRQRKKAG
ncbi:electron transport complex subunit RsxC [candidate division KSB1 bacterium]|nr:electron transport complex subunit RsxC [candidate division KSB1 bacterium]